MPTETSSKEQSWSRSPGSGPAFARTRWLSPPLRFRNLIQIGLHPREHGAKHVRCQHAGVGVVARAVVAVVKLERPGQVNGAVRERRGGAAQFQHFQQAVMRHTAKRDDRAQARHPLDRRGKKRTTRIDLRRQRLVLRRHAAHRVADAAIDQPQSIVGPCLILTFSESVSQQRRIEQVAGIVAGEGTPGAVGALQARCEADDQDPCAGLAKGGDRRVEPGGLLFARLRAKLSQPRAQRTIPIGFGEGEGGARVRRRVFPSRRNRRPRPVVPSWWRAAGIAARDDAARAAHVEPDVPTDRVRASIAARRGR